MVPETRGLDGNGVQARAFYIVEDIVIPGLNYEGRPESKESLVIKKINE
jgi:hypothetical protein